MAQRLAVSTDEGRELDVLVDGLGRGIPLVFHGGTPSAATEFPLLNEAAAAAGATLVTYSRPGYATSSPREGRSVADVTDDVTTILDHLELDRFVTLGWSGGGPHALACAALLPDRCLAAASLAGVAPYDAAGLDWYAGMAEENVTEFRAAADSRAAIEELLDAQLPALRAVTGNEVAAALAGLVGDVDRDAITGDFAEVLAALFRNGLSTGTAGWRDDDLAFVSPWGFDLSAISRPVSVWQGAHDRMVPFAHGEWLSVHVPNARVHLYADHGHISLVQQLPLIAADLMSSRDD